MEKAKMEKRQKLISASWFSFLQYTSPLSRRIQKLKTLALIEAEKSVTEIFIGAKNGQIMGMISRRTLILSYTIQQVIPNICTKFQNPRFSSSWEIFDEKKCLHTTQHPPPPHTHKHCYWKDKYYIPPIYFVYRGFNEFQNMRKSRSMTKPTKWPMRPVKTQIRLGTRPFWSCPHEETLGP